MKAVLALEHGIIPPTIGLEKLNPQSKQRSKEHPDVTSLGQDTFY